MRAFRQLPKASVNGARDVPPSAFILAKAGDSASCSRIHSETASRTTETSTREVETVLDLLMLSASG